MKRVSSFGRTITDTDRQKEFKEQVKRKRGVYVLPEDDSWLTRKRRRLNTFPADKTTIAYTTRRKVPIHLKKGSRRRKKTIKKEKEESEGEGKKEKPRAKDKSHAKRRNTKTKKKSKDKNKNSDEENSTTTMVTRSTAKHKEKPENERELEAEAIESFDGLDGESFEDFEELERIMRTEEDAGVYVLEDTTKNAQGAATDTEEEDVSTLNSPVTSEEETLERPEGKVEEQQCEAEVNEKESLERPAGKVEEQRCEAEDNGEQSLERPEGKVEEQQCEAEVNEKESLERPAGKVEEQRCEAEDNGEQSLERPEGKVEEQQCEAEVNEEESLERPGEEGGKVEEQQGKAKYNEHESCGKEQNGHEPEEHEQSDGGKSPEAEEKGKVDNEESHNNSEELFGAEEETGKENEEEEQGTFEKPEQNKKEENKEELAQQNTEKDRQEAGEDTDKKQSQKTPNKLENNERVETLGEQNSEVPKKKKKRRRPSSAIHILVPGKPHRYGTRRNIGKLERKSGTVVKEKGKGKAAKAKVDDPNRKYHCRHCNGSWPVSAFRNPQQFGAHCSNCSRSKKARAQKIAAGEEVSEEEAVCLPASLLKDMSLPPSSPSPLPHSPSLPPLSSQPPSPSPSTSESSDKSQFPDSSVSPPPLHHHSIPSTPPKVDIVHRPLEVPSQVQTTQLTVSEHSQPLHQVATGGASMVTPKVQNTPPEEVTSVEKHPVSTEGVGTSTQSVCTGDHVPLHPSTVDTQPTTSLPQHPLPEVAVESGASTEIKKRSKSPQEPLKMETSPGLLGEPSGLHHLSASPEEPDEVLLQQPPNPSSHSSSHSLTTQPSPILPDDFFGDYKSNADLLVTSDEPLEEKNLAGGSDTPTFMEETSTYSHDNSVNSEPLECDPTTFRSANSKLSEVYNLRTKPSEPATRGRSSRSRSGRAIKRKQWDDFETFDFAKRKKRAASTKAREAYKPRRKTTTKRKRRRTSWARTKKKKPVTLEPDNENNQGALTTGETIENEELRERGEVGELSVLPLEVLCHVLSFLPPRNLLVLESTCRYFSLVLSHDSPWRDRFCHDFGEQFAARFSNCPWKEKYFLRKRYIARRKPPTVRDPPSDPIPDRPRRGVWLVDKIIGTQTKTNPDTGEEEMYYFIRWKGYSDESNSWVSEEDLMCGELLDEFESNKNNSLSIHLKFNEQEAETHNKKNKKAKKQQKRKTTRRKRNTYEFSSEEEDFDDSDDSDYIDDEADPYDYDYEYDDEPEDLSSLVEYTPSRKARKKLSSSDTTPTYNHSPSPSDYDVCNGDSLPDPIPNIPTVPVNHKILQQQRWEQHKAEGMTEVMEVDEEGCGVEDGTLAEASVEPSCYDYSSSEEATFIDVPDTKEGREQQQKEFLRVLQQNPNYQPVILFLDKAPQSTTT